MTISDLIAAMVVNKDVREGVLNPLTRLSTIEKGYLGKSFSLTPEETDLILSIEESESLTKFARAIVGEDESPKPLGRKL